jgi:uncharacterized protein (TIGR00369 family)
MTPQNASYREATENAFGGQAFAGLLGMTAGHISPGHFDVHLLPDERHLQHDGIVHGGVLATLADTAVAMAGHTLVAAGERVVTVEFKISYLRPALAEPLVCRGRVLRPGRSITSSEADIVALRDGREILIAKALGTIAVIPAG